MIVLKSLPALHDHLVIGIAGLWSFQLFSRKALCPLQHFCPATAVPAPMLMAVVLPYIHWPIGCGIPSLQPCRQVDLLKVDVERAELLVLRGVRPDDWPHIRQVAMEVRSAKAVSVVTGVRQGMRLG